MVVLGGYLLTVTALVVTCFLAPRSDALSCALCDSAASNKREDMRMIRYDTCAIKVNRGSNRTYDYLTCYALSLCALYHIGVNDRPGTLPSGEPNL